METSKIKRAVVLGAGRVGSLIALDLARDPKLRVTAADRSAGALAALGSSGGVETCIADLADRSSVARAVADADVVIGAVPGALGFAVLETVIGAGRPVIDISFMPEDPFELDALAQRCGVPAVVDCGVAPGLSNWLVGRSAAELDEVDTVEILVGGLPVKRVWPYEYRAVFSPSDVIEEYTRPCRLRENGAEVVVPALSGIERVDFDEAGTLEAFYTDGLRTLLRTIPARTMREKTLRYPGHAEKMMLLREGGFLDPTPRRVGGVEVAPRAVTEALLFQAWALADGEEEFTVLRVAVTGRGGGERRRSVWNLFDRTDRATGTTSMARTTGYPCAIVARLLAEARWNRPGVVPPEVLGAEAGLTEFLLEELSRRGVRIRLQVETLGARTAAGGRPVES